MLWCMRDKRIYLKTDPNSNLNQLTIQCVRRSSKTIPYTQTHTPKFVYMNIFSIISTTLILKPPRLSASISISYIRKSLDMFPRLVNSIYVFPDRSGCIYMFRPFIPYTYIKPTRFTHVNTIF